MIEMLRRDDGTYWLAAVEETFSGAVYEMWGPFGVPRRPDELDEIKDGLLYGDVPELAGASHTHEQDGDLHEVTEGARWERYDTTAQQWSATALHVGYEH